MQANLLEKEMDQAPKTHELGKEVLSGLKKTPKELSCKLFYDEEGSILFDRICEQPEYYPTRTETKILEDNILDFRALLGKESALLEYGSGSSQKTRILLDNSSELAAYVPVDISREHLVKTSFELEKRYPNLNIYPVCADYNQDFDLPENISSLKKVIFFPGSTIGNFHPTAAVNFLRSMNSHLGDHGGIIIGVDLKKEKNILDAAYNDGSGYTAAFNKNILTHLNRDLDLDFSLDSFDHVAFYNPDEGRVEMHLQSRRKHELEIEGERIFFEKEERIWTESSYKYTLKEFSNLAQKANLTVEKVWVDEEKLFSVQYLSN